jgi:hypothetical protein
MGRMDPTDDGQDGRSLSVEDVRFEVRRAIVVDETKVELRRRMSCPSCAVTGEAFDPGPVLLVVEIDLPSGKSRVEQVEAGVEQCLQAAESAGIKVS